MCSAYRATITQRGTFPNTHKGALWANQVLTLTLTLCLCNDPPTFSYRDMVRRQSFNLCEHS